MSTLIDHINVVYDYTGSKVQGPQGLSVLFDLALTDRNMNAGCNFKGVLECWDSGILLSKIIFYDTLT